MAIKRKAHCSPKGRFLIVQSSSTGSVKDSATQTAIKKHVMRDIGKARRLYHFPESDNDSSSGTLRSVQPSTSSSQSSLSGARNARSNKQSNDSDQRQGYLFEHDASQPVSLGTAPMPSNPWEPHASSPNESSFTSAPVEPIPELPHAPFIQSCLDVYRRDPFARYPIRMTPAKLRLISLMFDTSLPRNLSQYREVWYQIGLLDRAAFFQVLSNFSLHIASLSVGSGTYKSIMDIQGSEESMFFHNKAVAAIKARLESDDEADWIEDGVLGTVIGFVCHAHLTQDWQAWQIHMDGLKAIIHKRGGISQIRSNKWLADMLFFVDSVGSYDQHLPTQLQAINTGQCLLEKLRSNICQNPEAASLLNAWACVHHNHASTVIPVLTDLIAVVEHLKREADRTGGRVWSIASALNPLVDRVVTNFLEANSEATPTSDALLERNKTLEIGVRAAGLLFIAELRRRVGVYPVVTAHFVKELATSFKQLELSKYQWGVLTPLRTWMLATGAVEAGDGIERSMFINELCMLRDGMFWDFTKLTEILEGVCWIREVHGPKLQKILESAGERGMISEGWEETWSIP